MQLGQEKFEILSFDVPIQEKNTKMHCNKQLNQNGRLLPSIYLQTADGALNQQLQALFTAHKSLRHKSFRSDRVKMQLIARAIKSCQERLRVPVLQQLQKYTEKASMIESPIMHQKGLENTTVADVLMTKEDEKVGSWLWCKSDDTVYDAVKQMARNNIGSLVVLKPGDEQLIAGIITERDYLQKVVVKDRSSKYTRVGEIMTKQDKLVTVTSDTNVYQAMRLMSENEIRHVPVIDGRIVGMISVVDVVRAVVEQQSCEVNNLNEFIKGYYY